MRRLYNIMHLPINYMKMFRVPVILRSQSARVPYLFLDTLFTYLINISKPEVKGLSVSVFAILLSCLFMCIRIFIVYSSMIFFCSMNKGQDVLYV